MNPATRCASRGTSIVIAVVLSGATSPAWSQQADGAEDIEEIVITGTRREGQSPTETLSPIDVLTGDALANQATFDMTDGLPKIAPSINTQRFPIADGTSFIRPVTLRNLSPDHTLVLVNGTRRHRSPLVNLQF
ncbi:MAG: TonB-dependent receptor plug domain-containing protein, partial [Woeseiaceae bacterium]